MKKIYLLFLVFTFVNHQQLFSQELIANTNFIDLSDWTPQNVGTNSGLNAETRTSDGSQSYQLRSNGSYNSHIRSSSINNSKVEAGTYLLSFYVKNIGVSTARIKPQIYQGTLVSGDVYVTSTTDWELVEQEFTITEDNFTVRIYNNTNVDGANTDSRHFLIDDVSFKRIITESPYYYSFTSTNMGWYTVNDNTNENTPINNAILLSLNNNYPKIKQYDHFISADTYKYVQIELKNNSLNDGMQMTFKKSDGSTDFNTKIDILPSSSSSSFEIYEMNITSSNWTGDQDQIEFVIKKKNGETYDVAIQSGSVEIKSINFFTTSMFTWTGNGDSDVDWNTATNWNSNSIPTSTDNVFIPSGLTNYPVIISSTSADINNINSEGSLTIEDGGSLIVNGSSSGNLTYNRNLGTTNWYLVSCPVAGEDMTDMRTNNNFVTNGSSEISFAPYDNSQVDPLERWIYFSNTATDVLTSGVGYSTKLDPSGDISFTGTLNTSDVETPSLAAGFNLIGNPFPSYVSSGNFLAASTSSNIDQTQIWLWNQGLADYEVKTAGTDWVLAPTQGFFVNAISAGTVTFDKSNQALTGNTFQKISETVLKLWMTDGEKNRYTKIDYTVNSTKGFDYGFEGETFGGFPNSLSVFTHLLEDNQGKNYQVQSLPNNDYENMVIPVGVIAEVDKEITFTAEAMNLPADLKVFLEDRENGVITRLDEQDGNYKITLNKALNGTGRFYLHASSSVLSADDIALTGVRVFAPNKSTLRVLGINSTNASVKVFSILGKKVLEKSFSSKGVSDINLPNLNAGVYIIQLNTEAGKLNRKVILE